MSIMGLDRADFRLMLNLWRMNLSDRYLGSALGAAWAVLNPLLMFALFTFVFGYVFKARLPGGDSTLAYSIWLICGYGPWLANTEALVAASNSIISNSGLVKNMSFKTEILPLAGTLLGLIPLAVSLAFLLFLQQWSGAGWSWSLVWIPLIVIVQFLLLAAIGTVFAVVTTFVRDFGIVLPNLLMIALFATPIFYPIQAVPKVIAGLMQFNPVYVISSAYRAALVDQARPELLSLAAVGLVSLLGLWISLGAFRRVKGFFPSVV